MIAIRRLSPLLLLAAALVALAVLFAPGAQPAAAQQQIRNVTLTVSPNPVVEGSTVTVTATISRSRNQNTTIPLVIPAKGSTTGRGNPWGVTAEAGDHGSLASITIPANATSATGTITTAQDDDEDDEIFVVMIGDPPPWGTDSQGRPTRAWEHGSPSLQSIRIIDDEGFRRVSLSAFPNPVGEGNDVDVYVTLVTAQGKEAHLSRAVTVPLTITDGTAEAGDHGSLASITIPAGNPQAKGTITTAQDTDADDETFTVALGRTSCNP